MGKGIRGGRILKSLYIISLNRFFLWKQKAKYWSNTSFLLDNINNYFFKLRFQMCESRKEIWGELSFICIDIIFVYEWMEGTTCENCIFVHAQTLWSQLISTVQNPVDVSGLVTSFGFTWVLPEVWITWCIKGGVLWDRSNCFNSSVHQKKIFFYMKEIQV